LACSQSTTSGSLAGDLASIRGGGGGGGGGGGSFSAASVFGGSLAGGSVKNLPVNKENKVEKKLKFLISCINQSQK